jgi:hypothetical protein
MSLSPAARGGALLLAAAVALAACGGATITPEIIYVTPAPPSETPTPEPTATPTPTPTPEPTPTPTPTPSPTSAAARCTATPEQRAYLADAAAVLKFDVYCAVLPSGWWLDQAQYSQSNGGVFTATYRSTAGHLVGLSEGRICGDMSTCLDGYLSVVGPALYGDLAASLYVVDALPTYGVYVSPHHAPAYAIYGHGMSQSQLKSFAAALVKVPKPGT